MTEGPDGFETDDGARGLTKREYFAGQALAGLLANPAYVDYTTLAQSAVEDADALLAELDKTKAAQESGD